jgi:putative heme-binding domain-containing protein
MPHNLVITKTGKLKEIAFAGAELGTTPGLDGKLYVPDSPDVLFSTNMVNAGQRELLTFNAPTEPGEYPYVCTFPRHWMRMYGVMIVVADLDAWQRNPTQPQDPLGNTRTFVQSWRLADFDPNSLNQELSGLNPQRGEKLFKEASCLGCHKMRGQGGAVGPELTDVLKRWKGDSVGVLREILEPSYKIDPKYAVKVVVDVNGKSTSGIVTAEDTKSISILENPELPNSKVIQKSDIEEIIPSSVSMMPKALLDKFSREEIIEILSYINQ